MADRRLFEEFPKDFFPPILEEFKESAAKSIGISTEYMVGPMLAAASVGIGTALTALPKPGWMEPASLFVADVGYKSSGKTPAFNLAMRPLEEQQREREKRAADAENGPDEDGPDEEQVEDEVEHEPDYGEDEDEDYEEDNDDNDDDEMLYGGTIDANVATASPHILNEIFQPSALPLQHLVLHDTTHAALWEVLQDSQRGVIVSVDELSSVFIQSSPAQRQVWCEIYQAGPRTVHRKTAKRGPIILPRTFTSLCGGIQPDLFPSIRGKYDGGLLERFLICGVPETSLPPWSDDVVDPTAETAWNLAIVALLNIEKAEYTGSRERRGYIAFTREAYGRLQALYESLQAYLVFRGVHVKHHGIVRKLVSNAARLALIRRCLRWAVGEFGFFGPVGGIDEADCDVACRAAEFFLSRYLMWMPQVLPAAVAPKPPVPQQASSLMDRVLAFMAQKSKTQVEVRWIRQQTLEGNPSTADLRAALDEAVAAGRGRWEDATKKTFICG